MYTRLEIVNEMIISTGARPLTAEQTRHPSYLKASELLERVQTSVQTVGWWFNTEVREIAQQASGEILVPQGVIRADPVDRHCNLTLRGRRMYNLDTGNYEIGADVCLRMIFDVPLEDLPLLAQDYIRARAVYEYYLNEDGADPKLSHYRAARDETYMLMYRESLRSKQVNIYDNPHNTINRLRRGYPSGRWSPLVR